MTRHELLELAAELGIDDEEAGEPEWQKYLSASGLADAINRLRPGADAKSDDED